jgi:hypothetical protein
MNHVDDYVVEAILDEEHKNEFFKNLNMFARDFYDYKELTLNKQSEMMEGLDVRKVLG